MKNSKENNKKVWITPTLETLSVEETLSGPSPAIPMEDAFYSS